jgi:STE24 endopeptidase
MSHETTPTNTPPTDQAVDAVTPDDVARDEMSADQLAEARQYGRWQLALDLADSGLDVLYLGLFAFFAAVPIDTWLAERISSAPLRLMALFGIMIGLHECVSFPLACFSGYSIEHRFGLSRQSFGQWLARHAKRFSLAVGFGAVMVIALYSLFWFVGTWWWAAAAIGFFLVSVVLGQLAPVLILPLFYKIEKLDNSELTGRFAPLAEESGLAIEGVYRMILSDETAKANAMLAGLGRTRRVLLGDTLLDGFSLDEIQVVFAHEIGHHVYRHIPKLMALGFVYSSLGFWFCDRMLALWIGTSVYDPRQLPVYALPMLMFALSIFSLVLGPLQNVTSRRFERQCDRFALRRTGLRDAYISAFRKLAKLNKDDPDPPRLAVTLFHSHPPIAERIAIATE